MTGIMVAPGQVYEVDGVDTTLSVKNVTGEHVAGIAVFWDMGPSWLRFRFTLADFQRRVLDEEMTLR